MKWIQTTAKSGLRLRESPKTGATLDALPEGTQLKVLAEETWIKVRTQQGLEGYVSADFTETSEAPNEAAAAQPVKTFIYQPNTKHIQGKPLHIAETFNNKVVYLENLLYKHNISLWVTSSLRAPEQKIQGAIYQPAKLSNHFVGHALDMNLFIGKRWFNSSKLKALPNIEANKLDRDQQQIMSFLTELKSDGELTWGGDFTPADPVHFDDRFNLTDPQGYLNQLKTLWPDYVLS